MVRNIDILFLPAWTYTGSWCSGQVAGIARVHMEEYDKKKPICAISAHMGQANYDLELIIDCVEGRTGCAE